MQGKGAPAQESGGSRKHDETSSHSAATTEPSSSPRDREDMAGAALVGSSPAKGLSTDEGQQGWGGAPLPKWMQLRDALMLCAAEGDKYCEKYGDIVANQGACERFLQ